MNVYYKQNKYYIESPCHINMGYTSQSIEEHTHDFLEIVYMFKGSAHHFVDDCEYVLSEGDLLFINYNSKHRFTVNNSVIYADIIIKPEFVDASLSGTENAFDLLQLENFKEFTQKVDKANCFHHFSRDERGRFEPLIKIILNEQSQNLAGGEMIMHSAVNTILTFVFRKMALPMSDKFQMGTKLLKYIKENCNEHITLEKVAQENHYSTAHLSRLFKKQTGCTFTEYLTNCRLEYACKLLRETELSVTQVCNEVGFSDRTKFHKLFLAKTGATPLKYKKYQN